MEKTTFYVPYCILQKFINYFKRSLSVDLLEVEIQSSPFEEVEYLQRIFIVGEAVFICIYVQLTKCSVNV